MKQIQIKLIGLTGLLLLTLFFIQCNDDIDPEKDGYFVPVFTDSGPQYSQKEMVVAAEGSSSVVYVAEELGWSDSQLNEVGSRVANTMDDYIYPTLTNLFGTPTDIDGNGKISIVIADISEITDGLVLGLFDAANHYSREVLNYSNFAEILYLDDDGEGKLPGDPFEEDSDLMLTVPHEFFHLLSFTRKAVESNSYSPEDPTSVTERLREELWLDEGLAEMASDIVCDLTPMCDQPREKRIADFQSIGNGILNFDSFDDVSTSNLERNTKIAFGYAHTYMFMRYLGDQFGRDQNYATFSAFMSDTTIGEANVERFLDQSGQSDFDGLNSAYVGFLNAIGREHLQVGEGLYGYETDLGGGFQLNLATSGVPNVSPYAFFFSPFESTEEITLTQAGVDAGFSFVIVDSSTSATADPIVLRSGGDSHTFGGEGLVTAFSADSAYGAFRGLNSWGQDRNSSMERPTYSVTVRHYP